MDPISAAGIALSVASLAGQVFTGCIQGPYLVLSPFLAELMML
jgi:hypothetical protein